MRYLIAAQPGSHVYLFDGIGAGAAGEWFADDSEAGQACDRQLRLVSDVPLNHTHRDTVRVTVLQVREIPPKGRIAGRTRTWTWVTDLPLTRATAAEAHACARSRWKIENETWNTLKNQGYELEHNFGHGHQHLATVLMLLACLLDQLQELCCPLFQAALAKAGSRYFFRDNFECPHCSSELKKGRLDIVYGSIFDDRLRKIVKKHKRVLVLINYSIGGKRYEKIPDSSDIELSKKIEGLPLPAEVPSTEIPDMQMMRVGRMQGSGVTHTHHFFLSRPAYVLGLFWRQVNSLQRSNVKSLLQFWLDSHLVNLSIRNRYRPEVSFPYNPLTGVFHVPSMVSEPCLIPAYSNKLKRIVAAFSNFRSNNYNLVQTVSTSAPILPPESQDYIFTDPPFGENIYYSDLNFFVESWYRVFTNTKPEAMVDKIRQKDLTDYQSLMQDCFSEYYRVLKPGRWITVEFSNSRASVWNAIQTTLQEAGFVIGNVAALDKKQRSFSSVTSPMAVKQDLVISTYKPYGGGSEQRFVAEAQTEERVWDFIRTHLSYLPTVKIQGKALQFIPERDPRILFDPMIAYFVRKGYLVSISSNEFQIGLAQCFIERDGMYFLSEQSVEYDRGEISFCQIVQASLFVSDEASSIHWLKQLLREKPQIYQDLYPQFIQRTQRAWNKNETSPELSILLEQNFPRYDGKSLVPEQIHAYLSTNRKELRTLPKDAPTLVSKARDRWHVPDPNKAGDLEQLREKALHKEFKEYKEAKKKLKVFRLDAVRAGFTKAWQERDYAVIFAVAEKIPNNVLEEDPKLLMWYDQAATRMGDE